MFKIFLIFVLYVYTRLFYAL